MKNIIIKNVYAVGMHHWGPRQLEIGSIYFLKLEEENPRDHNAVAVFEDRQTRHCKAYLRRCDALVISKLFRDNLIHGCFYLKPKSGLDRFSQRTGPAQKCNIGFQTSDENVAHVTQILQNVVSFIVY